MLGYRVPEPDEAMLISGGKRSGDEPFRVVTGHGAFVIPFIRKARFLSLSMAESEVTESCVTKQGIALEVRAVIAFKVGNDSESIVNAGQRFLSDQSQMSVLVGRIFAGHLRSIVGSMTVEEIVTERQKLAESILDGSAAEMVKIGLTVDAFQIQSIDDMKLGYIAAMAAPHNAAIQRQAQVAQAQADQAAADADQQSKRAQAEYVRQTTIVEAQYASDVAIAKAKANQAAIEAEQAATRAQAEFSRQTTVVQAQYASEISIATAKANQDAAEAEQASQRAQVEFNRADRDRAGQGQGRGRRGRTAGEPGRPAGPGAGRPRGAGRADRARRPQRRPASAAAGSRGRQAGRGRGRTDSRARAGRRQEDADPG